MTVCYSPWIILFQMTSFQRPALVSSSLSESMYVNTYTHEISDPRISVVTGSVTYILLSWLL